MLQYECYFFSRICLWGASLSLSNLQLHPWFSSIWLHRSYFRKIIWGAVAVQMHFFYGNVRLVANAIWTLFSLDCVRNRLILTQSFYVIFGKTERILNIWLIIKNKDDISAHRFSFINCFYFGRPNSMCLKVVYCLPIWPKTRVAWALGMLKLVTKLLFFIINNISKRQSEHDKWKFHGRLKYLNNHHIQHWWRMVQNDIKQRFN